MTNIVCIPDLFIKSNSSLKSAGTSETAHGQPLITLLKYLCSFITALHFQLAGGEKPL